MALLVIYDLRKPGRDYRGLYEELKRSPGWWHHLESAWILATTETPDDCLARLRPHIDHDDHMLVVAIDATTPRQGWLPGSAWQWLRRNV